MAQILELAHFIQKHGMAQMQIGRRGIEPRFNAQRTACLQARLKLLKLEYFLRTAADDFEGIFQFS